MRVFTKPDSEYLVATTAPPNKELDDVLERFAQALKEPEFPEIPDFRPKNPGPVSESIARDSLRAMSRRWEENDPRQQLFTKAWEAKQKAIEEYEPTEDELVAEDQLRMFCNGNP